MNCRTASVLTTLVILLTGSVWAHHSVSAVFDTSHTITIAGTLTKLDWRNPHIQFFLEAKGDSGLADLWVIEGGTPGSFQTRSIVKTDFERSIGRTITVEVQRAKDGSRYGHLQKITLPDGRSASFGGGNP